MYPTPRSRQAFTLVELVVVVVVLGVLATLGLAGYNRFTAQSMDATAQGNLRQATMAALSYHTAEQLPALTRTAFLDALAQTSVPVTAAGEVPMGAGWTVHPATHVPVDGSQFTLAFDDGPGTEVSDDGGSRALLMTRGFKSLFVRVVSYTGPGDLADVVMGEAPEGASVEAILADPALISSADTPAGP